MKTNIIVLNIFLLPEKTETDDLFFLGEIGVVDENFRKLWEEGTKNERR